MLTKVSLCLWLVGFAARLQDVSATPEAVQTLGSLALAKDTIFSDYIEHIDSLAADSRVQMYAFEELAQNAHGANDMAQNRHASWLDDATSVLDTFVLKLKRAIEQDATKEVKNRKKSETTRVVGVKKLEAATNNAALATEITLELVHKQTSNKQLFCEALFQTKFDTLDAILEQMCHMTRTGHFYSLEGRHDALKWLEMSAKKLSIDSWRFSGPFDNLFKGLSSVGVLEGAIDEFVRHFQREIDNCNAIGINQVTRDTWRYANLLIPNPDDPFARLTVSMQRCFESYIQHIDTNQEARQKYGPLLAALVRVTPLDWLQPFKLQFGAVSDTGPHKLTRESLQTDIEWTIAAPDGEGEEKIVSFEFDHLNRFEHIDWCARQTLGDLSSALAKSGPFESVELAASELHNKVFAADLKAMREFLILNSDPRDVQSHLWSQAEFFSDNSLYRSLEAAVGACHEQHVHALRHKLPESGQLKHARPKISVDDVIESGALSLPQCATLVSRAVEAQASATGDPQLACMAMYQTSYRDVLKDIAECQSVQHKFMRQDHQLQLQRALARQSRRLGPQNVNLFDVFGKGAQLYTTSMSDRGTELTKVARFANDYVKGCVEYLRLRMELDSHNYATLRIARDDPLVERLEQVLKQGCLPKIGAMFESAYLDAPSRSLVCVWLRNLSKWTYMASRQYCV